MAALADKVQSSKVLYIGDNGAGKTGSLISLAEAGYNLRVLDFDNGTEILTNLTAKKPEVRARIDVETHTDDYKQVGQALVPVTPLKGFSGGMKVLSNWPGLGDPRTWGPDTILVVDSLTMMGRFIINHVLSLNGRLGQQPQLQDWGAAMSLQESVMAMLYSASIKCHVIVCAHITFVTPEGALEQKGYPSALGNKLPPMIGSYFNSTIMAQSTGNGANKRKVIRTKPLGTIELKTPAPGIAKDEYPLETGLADYFRDLHGPLKAA